MEKGNGNGERERGTGNGNREQGTGNREQGTGNRERPKNAVIPSESEGRVEESQSSR
jgi:hypothetical protein